MAEIVVRQTEIQVVEVLAQGPPGVQGPPGETGGDTGRVTLLFTAGADLGGHRVVYCDEGIANYASADKADTACRITGITTHAAAPGAQIQVITAGPLTEPSWNWNGKLPVYCGMNGILTQTIDMNWQFLRVAGYPTGAQSMLVDIGEVIIF